MSFSPTIFWKLSQVLFRGTWSYQKLDPSFTDLSHQSPNESMAQVESYNSSTHPDTHIGNIASSVLAGVKDEAIAAMRNAFTTLRMEEMNGPDGLSLVERLKRENEALKRENEYLSRGSQYIEPRASFSAIEPPLRNSQYSDSYKGGRKRPWMGDFPNGRTRSFVDCSQDGEDDDMIDFQSVVNPHGRTVHIPLNDNNEYLSMESVPEKSRRIPRSSSMHEEVSQSRHQSTPQDTDASGYDTIVKRRCTSNASAPGTSEKRGRGRPRKSDLAPSNESSQTPKSMSISVSGGSQQKGQSPTSSTTPNEQPIKRKRGRPPGWRKSALGRPKSQLQVTDDNKNPTPQDSGDDQQKSSNQETESPNVRDGSEKENPDPASKHSQRHTRSDDTGEKRRRLIAMRDRMAEEAMRHEEELAGEVDY